MINTAVPTLVPNHAQTTEEAKRVKVEEENESKRMLSDLSKRVDDLQDSVSKIAEALSYLMASSSDKEEKEELAEKVDLLSSYANECIEHNDAVCVVWVD